MRARREALENGVSMFASTRAIFAGTFAVIVFTGAGCDTILGHSLNRRFCEAHTSDVDCKHAYPDAGTDGPQGCTSDQQCAGAAPVCDLEQGGSMTCVECTVGEHGACLGATPTCVDNMCSKCTAHMQCEASNVCLPDGSCADAGQVAYVAPTGTDNDTCSIATPCKTVAKALSTARPYVKFHGTTDEAVSINMAAKVTWLADPGAKLTRTNNGVILEIRGTSQVAIYDLEISGASGMDNPGISLPAGNMASLSLTRARVLNNTGGGVGEAGGTVSVIQSIISGNSGVGMSISGGFVSVAQSTIEGNPGGGLVISGSQYDISNSFIVKNGGPTAAVGGVSIGPITALGTHRFDFNTVAGNQTSEALTAGVVCSSIAIPLVFADSIVFSNSGNLQVNGTNCQWNYSDVVQALEAGTGNINQDPQFANTSTANYHLQSTSAAKNAADPVSAVVVDFDGERRPQDGRSDMGADEVAQ